MLVVGAPKLRVLHYRARSMFWRVMRNRIGQFSASLSLCLQLFYFAPVLSHFSDAPCNLVESRVNVCFRSARCNDWKPESRTKMNGFSHNPHNNFAWLKTKIRRWSGNIIALWPAWQSTFLSIFTAGIGGRGIGVTAGVSLWILTVSDFTTFLIKLRLTTIRRWSGNIIALGPAWQSTFLSIFTAGIGIGVTTGISLWILTVSDFHKVHHHLVCKLYPIIYLDQEFSSATGTRELMCCCLFHEWKQISRTRAESQQIVAQRPLSCVQYPVLYLSRLQRICPSRYLNLFSA